MELADRRSWKRILQSAWFRGALIIVLTILAYLPAMHAGFIWDDDAHITEPELRSAHGLVEIWTRLGATQQYYPFVHTVFWIEHRLWGDSAFGYHLVNVLVHAVGAFVLLQILLRLKIPGALLAAGLFALHPVQVESVAWISELKNTLSGLFFFSSILTYLNFDETRSRRSYLASLVLFLFGLICKTVIAPLPAVVLVVLWWKRGTVRPHGDVAPLLPFFGLGVGAGLFTAWVERHFVGAQGTEFQLSILQRGLIAARDFWFYLFKLFWPAKLTFIYPRWQINAGAWSQYVFLLGLALVLLLALNLALRKQMRGLLAAALIFLGLLFPALGFINVYPFVYSFVADHFQYLACAAPLTLFAVGITIRLDTLAPAKTFLRPVIYSALLLTVGVLSWRQCRDHRDIKTLWRTTIARNPDCWMAHNNLGNRLCAEGQIDEGISHLREAVRLQPNDGTYHFNLATALAGQRNFSEAFVEFRDALSVMPESAEIRNNFAIALAQAGKTDEAIEEFKTAVRIKPDYVKAHYNLGYLLVRLQRRSEALLEFKKVVDLKPDFADAKKQLEALEAAKAE
jgi:tetratricopeptide (TPR) repeat protein